MWKLQKPDLKSVFIDGKKYTNLKNRKFDLFFPIFYDFTWFFKTRKWPKNWGIYSKFEIFEIDIFFYVNKNTF